MTRKIKKTLILAAVEATPGTAATPTAADALLISDASFSMEYNNVERNIMRPWLGHGGTLLGTRHVQIEFTVELSGSGTAGVAPAWGKLLLGCGFAETVTPNKLVEYTPVSEGLKTLTIKYSADGVIHTALSCMGTVTFGEQEGEKPTLKFNFIGVDAGSAAAAAPTADFTAWKIPEVVNSHNSGRLTFGGVYDSATGDLDSAHPGQTYCSRGLTLDMANDAKYLALLGCSHVDITDRKPNGKFALALDGAQEVAMRAEINANQPTSLFLKHGSRDGLRVHLFVARAVRLNPSYEDYEGQLLLSCDFNAEPDSGNDEIRIACL